ncbi:MAG TPA: fused MFS/spermidine synthase [Opitutaceae bacterium]|nr:fused MFS/spermidine synthase [Opitutaceae bacterium]
MLPFAFTIFAGAFLLFAVQPLIGKFILPWFGGGPGVWATCLLFFQMLLLAGYAYAHFTTSRLTPRRQALVHLGLLVLALAVLPIIPDARWKPAGGSDPVWGILLLLTVTLGLPYFVLSSTGPLMQQWSSRTLNAGSPYRLYALSNAGSLLALLGYPFYFERVLSRQAQAGLWSVGFGIFALGCAWCAWRVARTAGPLPAAAPAATGETETPAPPPAAGDRVLWFTLSGAASILLMATTNKLCQDLAVIPFLWVLPLSLYLVSFILCFDHPRWYSRGFFGGLFILGALVDCQLLFSGHTAPLMHQVVGYSTTLFAGCMLCHGELYRLRPPATHLTSFYLSIAGGGAAGGVLVALIAPLVFNRFLELHIGLWLLSYLLGVLCFRQRSRALALGAAAGALAATFVIPLLKTLQEHSDTPFASFGIQLQRFHGEHWSLMAVFVIVLLVGTMEKRRFIREWRPRLGAFPMTLSLGLGILLMFLVHEDERLVISTSRNFYGVLKVFEHSPDDPQSHYFSLVHGVTAHGLQFAEMPQAAWATTYYGNRSGVGLAIEHTPRGSGRKIGLVGLGTGTLAIHGRADDKMRIYEIDPDVERLARSRFTYLALSPADVEVVLGDARLSMERELANGQRQNFDVLALDAFSSDAIPVHLLTVEAFTTYLAHLKPNGVIAVHTSNRYLDLRPVVENAAKHFGLESAVISDDENEDWWVYRTTWILLTKNQALLDNEEIAKVTEILTPPKRAVPLWTDDHASLIEILK